MKFLIDTSAASLEKKIGLFPDLVAGQLLTPLTRYSNAGRKFAIDNGAFSGFPEVDFFKLLKREESNRESCLFVCCPDVVAAGRRTMEIWKHYRIRLQGWRLAFVAQDGVEDLEIPWDEIDALFIGGGDPWKDSKAAQDLVKTAKILGKHSHIGRVNTIKRFKLFSDIGADTCDGSGVAMYDHMLQDISDALNEAPQPVLFNKE